VATVADLVDEDALAALVDDPAIVLAGDELADTGAVRLIEFGPLRVLAEVDDGGGTAEVELAAIEGRLEWACDCSDGAEGRACRHLVAAARETWRKAPKRQA
jgi:hypothetical protein